MGTMKISGIYIIKNAASGKFYIGSSSNVAKRWKIHKNHLTTDGNVICRYESLQEAAKNIGAKNTSHITMVLKGQRKNAYGFSWRYAWA